MRTCNEAQIAINYEQMLYAKYHEEPDPPFMPLAVNPPLTPTLSAFTLLSALRPPPPVVKEMTGRIEVRSQVASARARSRTAAGLHREREEPDATY